MLFVVRQRNGIMAIFSYEPKPQRGHDGFQTKKCLVNSEDITKKKHKKKTKNNQKKTTHAKTPNASGGEALCPPHKKWHKKNTNAKTPNASFEEHYRKKQQMQKHPMHLGGGASHSHITKKINENKKKYGKNEVSHLYFFVLKLPCLDVETDAKNPRQAGTVAKNPRGTDAKNPPQLAPLQKTPVTVWNVPTVAKNPYYRRKKPQPLN